LDLKRMWVRVLFNPEEETAHFGVGQIVDVSATNELTIKFPVDGWQTSDIKVSEINNEYIVLITNEAAMAELPSSLLRESRAARQGPSCLTRPKQAIPRELLQLLDNNVMLARI